MKERNDSQVITRIPKRVRDQVDQEAAKLGMGTSGFVRMTLFDALASLPAEQQPSQHEAA